VSAFVGGERNDLNRSKNSPNFLSIGTGEDSRFAAATIKQKVQQNRAANCSIGGEIGLEMQRDP